MDLPIVQTDIARFQGDEYDQTLFVQRLGLPVNISGFRFIFTVGDPGAILGEFTWTAPAGSTNGQTILTIPAVISGMPLGTYFYTIKYLFGTTVVTFMAGNLIIDINNNPLST